MNWNSWLSGLVVAALGGVLNGAIALSSTMTWKEIGLLILTNAAKDMLLWMKSHPADQPKPPTP